MRKTIMIGIVAAVALVTAAIAMAAVYTASGVSATTASFSTDKVSPLRSASCTGADGKAFTITHGHYTGTATFTAPAEELGGPLTIDARTTYSTTDGLGYVEGSFRVRDDRHDPNHARRPVHRHAQGHPARGLPRRRRRVAVMPACSAT